MAGYVKYTEVEIVKTLESCGFKRVKVDGTRETVMEREVENFLDRRIRVYTSAVEGRDARACGKDALRVLVLVRTTHKHSGEEAWLLQWSARRVHRTENFLTNLQERCRLAWKVATTRCPECKSIMVPRRKKGTRKDTFWGCIRFPVCRSTINM